MKKTLSAILAVVMALSLFQGINFSAFAAQVENAELKLTEPIKLTKDVDGYLNDFEDDDTYFEYFYIFSDGDTAVITFSDGTVKTFTFSTDEYDFLDEKGKNVEWDLSDNQSEEHWNVGTHSAFLEICGTSIEFSVEVVENPIKAIKKSFTVKDVTENTCGIWDVDDNDNDYFYYFVALAFDEGDKITLEMKDGTSIVYTYAIYYDEVGNLYASFIDDDFNELFILNDIDDQFEEHWGLGQHSVVFNLPEFGVDFEVIINITKGSPETCWHLENWEFVNGLYQSKCPCGNVEVIPFVDIAGYDYYVEYIAYTSVYNSFLKGTNPDLFNLFSPKTAINRAMMITILYRMAGEPYANGSNPYKTSPFTDITNKSVYYYDAACWALKNGITTETTFKPFDNVTREQTASFLFRFAKLNNWILDDQYKEIDLKKEYLDASLIHPWAVEAMQWANYNEMITGTLQKFANPQGQTQRIHATKILCNFGWAYNVGNAF